MEFYTFAALAGAIQMVAPDRWMPASVFAWQKGWRANQIAGFSLVALLAHLGMGAVIYAMVALLPRQVPQESLGFFTLVFLGLIGTLRAFRFARVREVLFRSPDSRRAVLSILSLLGPSEMVVPVLLAARVAGVSWEPTMAAMLVGSWVAGMVILTFARASWNRPMALPSAVQWCRSRTAALPMMAGLLVGVALMVFHP